METPYHLHKLREEFSRRKRANALYSLRAFSRDLAIPASTLSLVLLGKRPFPPKNSAKVLDRLVLNASERTRFADSLGRGRLRIDEISTTAMPERLILDESYFQIIAEWEHYAALSLFDCSGFKPSVESIAERLGIPRVRAEVVVQNLLNCGLLVEEAKRGFVRTVSHYRTTEDVRSPALRMSHLESLVMATEKLDSVAVQLRDFSSVVAAIDPERIDDAKAVIREFRLKMKQLFGRGNRRAVYQLNIQLYPLSPVPPESESRNTKVVQKKGRPL